MRTLFSLLLALTLCLSASSAAAPAKKPRATVGKKPAGKATKRLRTQAPTRKPATAMARTPDHDAGQVNFSEWKAVSDFADDVALRHGFPRAELTALIGQIKYVDAAVQLVKPGPPGKPKNMHGVRALNIEPIRIRAGVTFWNDHAEVLARAEREFGVPAEIVAGIIGIETVYGRNTGRFRVLDVLTTLAFAYPVSPNQATRMAFFRGELENALVLARKNGIDPFSLLGSFAGAIGMPQFMPGSVLAYGIDYNSDGVIDLRHSPVDVVGSVANFLVQHGWKRAHGGPAVIAAHVSPGKAWTRFLDQGLEATFKVGQLQAAGVATAVTLPTDRLYGLVDLQNGANPTEYWLASDNFFAITKYNRSYYYAMSVIELGRAVKLSRAELAVSTQESL